MRLSATVDEPYSLALGFNSHKLRATSLQLAHTRPRPHPQLHNRPGRSLLPKSRLPLHPHITQTSLKASHTHAARDFSSQSLTARGRRASLLP